jgi:hypothetical protein
LFTTTPTVLLGKARSCQAAPLGWGSSVVQVWPPSKVASSPAAEAMVMSWSEAAANACWFPQTNTGLDALKRPSRRGAVQI